MSNNPFNMEIREKLYQKVKFLKSRAGREMNLILTEPVRDEKDLLSAYESIKNLSPEDAIEFFGASTNTNRKNINSTRYKLFADLVRIAVYNEECDDYLKLLSQAHSQPDVKVRKNLIFGANGKAKSERLLPAEEITDVSEIRKLLKNRFSSVRGEVGKELMMIESSPIHREEQFVELFNLINTKRSEDLPVIFGEAAEEVNFDNYKSKLFKYLINISIFNDECDDTLEQMKRAIAYPRKSENLGYFTVYYGKRYAQEKLRRKSERVLGENNPGHNHGGRLSPFSKNYVKYQEVDESAKESLISDLIEKANVTRDENPQNQPTRIEYYIARGLNEEEARKALSERQSTFSLEKCIEKYGEIDGMEVWKERQSKWQSTMTNLPIDEKYRIARLKARGAWNLITDNIGDEYANVYLMREIGGDIYKVGITTNLKARIGQIRYESKLEVCIVCTTQRKVRHLIDVEDALCQKFRDRSVFTMLEGTDNEVSMVEYFVDQDHEKVMAEWFSVVNSM